MEHQSNTSADLRKPVLLVSLGVWGGYYALHTVMIALERGAVVDIVPRSIVYGSSAVLTYVAGIACFRTLRSNRSFRWLIALLIAVGMVLAHSLWASVVYAAMPPTEWIASLSIWALFSQGLYLETPVVTTAFFALFAVYYGQESAARERALLLSDLSARRAQLETLRYQLNPHFLFNTLNTISNIVMEDKPDEAEKAIQLLSRFLRRGLEADPLQLVPLAQEFENITEYLSIEQIRFEDRLVLSINCDPEAKDWMVPPFLLQPVLENVIKHAISKVVRPVHVDISAEILENRLEICIEDDGPGMPTGTGPGKGFGLRTTKERLALTFGEAAKVRIRTKGGAGFAVTFQIPRKSLQSDVPHFDR